MEKFKFLVFNTACSLKSYFSGQNIFREHKSQIIDYFKSSTKIYFIARKIEDKEIFNEVSSILKNHTKNLHNIQKIEDTEKDFLLTNINKSLPDYLDSYFGYYNSNPLSAIKQQKSIIYELMYFSREFNKIYKSAPGFVESIVFKINNSHNSSQNKAIEALSLENNDDRYELKKPTI